jgi:rsbT co-antagonist protein RsbR
MTQEAINHTVSEQRRTIEDLETPVLEVWDGILALPLIGSVDTRRAQLMNERLLQRIVETGSEIVLVDISAVPVVDTAVSRHLLETVTAARLLGAEVIIVGLNAVTAMTLVQLGESLSGVTTRTTMAKGLQLALRQLGYVVRREAEAGKSEQAG